MNPAQRFRPPPLRFGEQNRKIFLTFFNCAPPKFFSIHPHTKRLGQQHQLKVYWRFGVGVKETKNFLFCPPALAGIAETSPPHSPPAWAEFIPYNPEGICAGASNFFWRTGYNYNLLLVALVPPHSTRATQRNSLIEFSN